MRTIAINKQRLLAALMPAALLAVPAVIWPNTGWSQQIDEVTVTARRREENVQDIPVSVTAFGADFIEKQGVINTKDVVHFPTECSTSCFFFCIDLTNYLGRNEFSPPLVWDCPSPTKKKIKDQRFAKTNSS